MTNTRESLLWTHFVSAEGGTATCKTCLKTKGGNTTLLRKHLKSMHQKLFDEVRKAEDDRKKKKKEAEDANKRKVDDIDGDPGSSSKKQPKFFDFSERYLKYSSSSDKQKEFDEAIVTFLADTFVPFNVVGQDTFKKLFDIADRKLTVKHQTTYSHMVTDTAQNTLSKVVKTPTQPQLNST